MLFCPTPPYVVPTTLYDVIRHLGQESSLLWVIDAGDAASIASASNQSLGVLPSGGVQMIRGNDTGSDADRDPVHRGTIGGQSTAEYWEMNNRPSPTPSRRFISSGNSYWKQLHKDGATWTIAGWYRLGVTPNQGQLFFTTMPGTALTDIGVSFAAAVATDPGKLSIEVFNGSGSAAALQTLATSLDDVPTGQDIFVALSVNEAGNAMIFQLDNSQQSTSCTFSSPSSSDPTLPNEVVAAGAIATVASEVLSRLYNCAFWNRVLSAAELLALYNAQKAKFGH